MIPSKLHISNGISKLGASIPSVSLPPVTTCRPGAPCAKLCYARKGRFAFRRNKLLLQSNLSLWKDDPECFERDLTSAAYASRFFRYHSAGDIPDENYLHMMCRVAMHCPATNFLCFTKKYELVNRHIRDFGPLPGNLRVVLSAWGDFVPDNPNGLPVAYVRLKGDGGGVPESAMPCSGYCGACVQTGKSCWDMKPGDSVVFNQH